MSASYLRPCYNGRMAASAVLQTARLVLRPPAASDAAPLARVADDFAVACMTTRMPFPYTLADAQAFLDRVEAADPALEITWTIADGASDIPLGVLGFFTDDSFAPELGYWLGRPAWGRGYAGEAVAAALGWFDTVWRRPCVVAGCFTDNPASRRVLEKSGFLPTGVVAPRGSLARGGAHPCLEFIRLA